VETTDGDLWLNGADGVTRVSAVELRRAIRDAGYQAQAERFDFRDGMGGSAPQVRPLPSAIEGTDGRLWFSWEFGAAWVDPRRVARNVLPPPVHVRALMAGGRRYEATGGVTLPARTTALDIEYTALSLTVPEHVRFRYRLLGDNADTAWQDVGTRREAVYTNLGPGTYRFHVIAANDDGVWNTRGATLNVTIPHTFVQTRAFVALCASVAGCAAWLLLRWRHRRVADAIRARFDATVAERMRIARELHDTLLSEVAGIAMRLDAAAKRAATGRGEDASGLAALRDAAHRTLDNARGAVVAMRASADAAAPALDSARRRGATHLRGLGRRRAGRARRDPAPLRA
jgi:hypothetical protein